MNSVTSATAVATTARANDITLFASLELSKSKWVVTINSPGSEKFSRHMVEGGDGAGLLDLLSRSRAKAEQRYGVRVKTIVIEEAGLDGFSIHRLLIANGIESHVVDAASIAVARRHRRAKTDAIDGETLLRTLMAWARGERRVCSMVRAPSPQEEDRRRLTRERGTLLKERIQHTNRVKGLPSRQGVRDYNPLRRDRFERLEALRTGDGRELPPLLKAEIRRELDRIALATTQLAAVERARDAFVRTDAEEPNNPAALLLKLKGLGPEFASLAGIVVPQLHQPTPGGGLRRIGAQPLAEWRRRTGSGHLEVSPFHLHDHDTVHHQINSIPGLELDGLMGRWEAPSAGAPHCPSAPIRARGQFRRPTPTAQARPPDARRRRRRQLRARPAPCSPASARALCASLEVFVFPFFSTISATRRN